MKILIPILLAIVSEAIGDGLEYHEIYMWSHPVQLTTFIMFALIGFYTAKIKGQWWKWFPIFFAYVFFRFAIFDAIYNLVIGQDLLYIGTQSLYDLFWSKAPGSIIVWFKGISLLFGIGISLDNIRNK